MSRLLKLMMFLGVFNITGLFVCSHALAQSRQSNAKSVDWKKMMDDIERQSSQDRALREQEQKKKDAQRDLYAKRVENECQTAKDRMACFGDRMDAYGQMEHYEDMKDEAASKWKVKIGATPYQFLAAEKQKFSSTEDIKKVPEGKPFSVYKYSRDPVYYLNFSDAAEKGLMLDRLRAFAELTPGRALDDAALQAQLLKAKMSYDETGGQDFQAKDLASFFTKADETRVKLNLFETRLKDELLNSHLLEKRGQKYVARAHFAVIATAQQKQFERELGQADGKQAYQAAFEHELNHGIYFTDEKYSGAVKELWSKLDADTRKFIGNTIDLFDAYDFENNDDLLIREFAAYFRDPKALKSGFLNRLIEGGKFQKDNYPRVERLGAQLKAIEDRLNSSPAYTGPRGAK